MEEGGKKIKVLHSTKKCESTGGCQEGPGGVHLAGGGEYLGVSVGVAFY